MDHSIYIQLLLCNIIIKMKKIISEQNLITLSIDFPETEEDSLNNN